MQEDQELLDGIGLLLIGVGHIAYGGFCELGSFFQIEFVPLLRCHLPFIGGFTAAIERLLLDDVQHNLGVHVTTGGAGTGFRIRIFGCFLEIGDSIDGVTVEHGVATFIQEPQTVEEFIDIAGGLVDVYHDELALVCLLLQEADDLLGICRRES